MPSTLKMSGAPAFHHFSVLDEKRGLQFNVNLLCSSDSSTLTRGFSMIITESTSVITNLALYQRRINAWQTFEITSSHEMRSQILLLYSWRSYHSGFDVNENGVFIELTSFAFCRLSSNLGTGLITF